MEKFNNIKQRILGKKIGSGLDRASPGWTSGWLGNCDKWWEAI